MDKSTKIILMMILVLVAILIAIVVSNPTVDWLPIIIIALVVSAMFCLITILTFLWTFGPLFCLTRKTDERTAQKKD